MTINVDKLVIGFSLLRGGGGPTTFMRRLRASIREQGAANTAMFLNPLTDINVYANAVRNPWRRPYVFRVDGISFDRGLGGTENARRNKPIFEGIDSAAGVIFQSQFDRDLMLKLRRHPTCSHVVVPNGVDLNQFTPNGSTHRQSLNISPDALVFMSSAKWRAHKRLDAVIRAFVQFQEVSGRVVHLIILGSLDEFPNDFPDRVHCVGHVPPDLLPAWYRTADLFLFMSWLDHCPNTVIEALACGIPVVCSNQGGTHELIEMTGGGIVVQADEPFGFQPLELYRPPPPDSHIVLKGVLEAVMRRQELSAKINRSTIDINLVARRYVKFMTEIHANMSKRK